MRVRVTNFLVGVALLLGAGWALPALSQGPLGNLGGSAPQSLSMPDANEGRFTAMGGIFGGQRVDCIRCHGLDGMGDSSGAFPRLAGQNAWYLYKTLTDYAAGRRPSEVMVPIARSLSDSDMRELAAYYASVVQRGEAEPPGADLQVLQQGGAIAAVGIPRQAVPACSSCHGTDGAGLPPVSPALAGQFAPYLEHQLLLWKQGLRKGDPMDVMARIASAMSPEQIRAVSLYYATIRQADLSSPAAEEPLTPAETELSAPAAPDGPAPPGPDAGFAPDVLPPYLPGSFDEDGSREPATTTLPKGG